jgi:hypothetical protein
MIIMVHRGTTNRNDRGNADQRRKRRAWIVQVFGKDGIVTCVWCAVPMLEHEFEVDRVLPGRLGGRYHRDNIVPSCPPCNAERGNADRDGVIW